jgi:hypothetical protein
VTQHNAPADLYRAVASCHLNFYPGTLTPTPPDYRHTRHSDPMPYADAVRLLGDWRDSVQSPGCWHFSVVIEPPQPDSAAAGCGPRVIVRCACGKACSVLPGLLARCHSCGEPVGVAKGGVA